MAQPGGSDKERKETGQKGQRGKRTGLGKKEEILALW
jgi:hypothetical protein